MSTVSQSTVYDSITIQALAESILASSKGFLAARMKKASPELYETIRQTNLILSSCLTRTGVFSTPSPTKVTVANDKELYAEGMRKAAETIAGLMFTRKLDSYPDVAQILTKSIGNLNQVEKRYVEEIALTSRHLDLYYEMIMELSGVRALLELLERKTDATRFNSFIGQIKSLDIQKCFFFSNGKQFYAYLENKQHTFKTDLMSDILRNYFDLLFLTGGLNYLPTYQPAAILLCVRNRLDLFNGKIARMQPHEIEAFQPVVTQQIKLFNKCLTRSYPIKSANLIQVAAPTDSPSEASSSSDPAPRKRKASVSSCSSSVSPEPKKSHLDSSSSPSCDFAPLFPPLDAPRAKRIDTSIDDLFIAPPTPRIYDEEGKPFKGDALPLSPFYPYSFSTKPPLQIEEELHQATDAS